MKTTTPSNRARRPADAIKVIDRMVGDDAELRRLIDHERTNLVVGRMIYQARTAKKLSQKALAQLVGTTQSVIARLESADYDRPTLATLRRIAAALGLRLEVRLLPQREPASSR